MGGMKDRKVIVFQDWSKGCNLQDRLLDEGVSQDIRNFNCNRKGVLEKVCPHKAYSYPSTFPWVDGEMNDFFISYLDGMELLIVLAGVGTAEPMIAIHNGTAWSHFDVTSGHLDANITGIRIVEGNIGNISAIRIYPQYGSAEDLDSWAPMLLVNKIGGTVREQWNFTELSTYVLQNGTKCVTEWDGHTIHCSCGKQYLGTNYLKPCVAKAGGDGDSNTIPDIAECDLLGFSANRTDFETDFSVNDVIGIDHWNPIKWGSTVGTTYRFARVLTITDDVEIVTPDGIDRANVQAVGAGFYVSRLFKVDDDQPETDVYSSGLKLLVGIPTPIISGYIYPNTSYINNQWVLPSTLIDCVYTGGEYVKYGASYILIDGSHTSIVETSVSLPSAFAGSEDGFVSFYGDFYPGDANTRDFLMGINLWRRNTTDGEWKHLCYVPYQTNNVELAQHPVENAKVFWGPSGSVMMSFPENYGVAIWVDSILDWGQALSENVFSMTGGLEEGDMGLELALKSPISFGRKIIGGNVAELRRHLSNWTPKWIDDDIRYSIYDQAWNFNEFDYLSVASGDADHIVKILFHGRQMAIFKLRSVYIVEVIGTAEGSWKLVATLPGGITGWEKAIITPAGPVWLASEAAYLWDGQKAVSLSGAFEEEYKQYIGSSDDAIVGYDRITNKLHITEIVDGKRFIINMSTGAMHIEEGSPTLKFTQFRNDSEGRLMGRMNGATPYYIEAKESEIASGGHGGAGSGIWNSGQIDVHALVGKFKAYTVFLYMTYKQGSGAAGYTNTIKFRHMFDGYGEVTHTINLANDEDRTERVVRLDIWGQGRMLELELDTNETIPYFDEFKLWKVALTVRAIDVD